MKRKHLPLITFILFFIFCFSALSTLAQTNEKRPSAIIRGGNFSYKLYDETFTDTPVWNPENGEPQISISRAIQIAKANLPRFVESSEKFTIRDIRLLQYKLSGKWFYVINFLCMGTECRNTKVRNFQILVKMDESIIEPKILPPDF